MKSLSSKTYQCGVTIQGLTTLAGTTYITGITNTASWDHVIVGTTAQGQIYTRTYAQFMGDVVTGINLSSYVPTSRTLTINGTGYDLSADRSWTITTPFVSKLQHTVKAGVAINKGQAVYVTGADGTNMIVGLASNASEATSSKTMGLLDATVSTNGFANVVTEGLLAGLDTTGATAAGDPVWLGTGGNLIYGLANKPYAPAHLVFIGIVTRKNANNGEIFVKVQNGFELNEIHDVDLKTNLPTAGQLLRYDSDGLWKNWSPNYLTAESDTLATVTSRGATTSTPVTFNGNVTLGNAADLVFVDLAGTYPTSGKGFDWTLNDDGARIYAIQPSSDSIDLVFKLRDNATTNDRFVFWVDEWQGPAYDKYPLIISGGTQFDLKDSSLYTNTVLRLSNSGVLQNVTGNISMFTNNVGYLTSYTETDTLATVTGRGATTTSAVTVGTSLSITGPNRTVSMTSSSNYLHIQAYAGSTNGAQLWLGNDNDPGFYVNASQHFFRGLDSSNKMYINGTSGNVGIGTTSPDSKLHIEGTTTGSGSGADAIVHIKQNGGWNGNEPWALYVEGYSYLNGFRVNAYDTQRSLYSSAGELGFAVSGNSPISFTQNTSDYRMYIAPGGNVGIGTINPPYKLTVVGDTYVNTANLHLNTGYGIVDAANISYKIGFPSLGNFAFENVNVGIGTTSPSTKLDVNGVITATGGNSTNWNTAYGWGNHSSAGYVPQARTLTINGTTYDLSANRSWTIATTTPGGSNTQFQYNSSGTLAGASALTYNSATNRVGINQASPGYDLDVNGQVRVQDKLRVGNVNSGNGVVHMSSTATINPSATTIVWSQNVSVGMCAFIEYYILNNNTTTDQRAGTIMVTWNQSGTPTIAHTETTTPDIGSTTPVIFTSSLVGSDARINAVNSSSAPYTIVMSYKYF